MLRGLHERAALGVGEQYDPHRAPVMRHHGQHVGFHRRCKRRGGVRLQGHDPDLQIRGKQVDHVSPLLTRDGDAQCCTPNAHRQSKRLRLLVKPHRFLRLAIESSKPLSDGGVRLRCVPFRLQLIAAQRLVTRPRRVRLRILPRGIELVGNRDRVDLCGCVTDRQADHHAQNRQSPHRRLRFSPAAYPTANATNVLIGDGCANASLMTILDQNALKRAAAARALEFVRDGMKLGLGTGSTAEAFLDLLAERVRAGLKITGTPTSERTREKASALSIPVAELDSLAPLDLVIDGADEADHNLDLIKGGGGALLREKIVAASAARLLVIADESKLVRRLGAFPLPIEVIAFGHRTTASRIAAVAHALGHPRLTPRLRMKDGQPFRTDSGNVIYDCPFVEIGDAPALAAALSTITGVVEHGLFVGLASHLVIAGASGVRVIERK